MRSLVLALTLGAIGFAVPGSPWGESSSAGGAHAPTTAARAAGRANRLPNARNQERSGASGGVRSATAESVRVGVEQPGGGYTIVSMPLDTYVARVVAGEAARNSQPVALEALAITVRTFAAANRGRHRADGFDLCDQTHCQVLRAATAATERAAQATAGRVLLREGAPAIVYYSASCGGRTAIPSEVWPGHEDPPYLPSKDDDACEGAPAWTTELSASDLRRALRSAGFRGDLRDVRVASHQASGRVAWLRLDGLRPDRISGQDLRVAVGRVLGWQHIKSTAFDLQKRGDAYRFSGHGSGHGVGLCVIGSARLAERGATVEAILARYFPGLEVSSSDIGARTAGALLPPTSAPTRAAPTADSRGGQPTPARPPTPRHAPDPAATSDPTAPSARALDVRLPDEDEGERATIEKQTLKARDELARTLGVPPPAHLTLRFHPTTDAYEAATGRAWFTSAALVRGELHLLPLATLRERGMLERTIRHELVHLMTDAALAGRPQWVREGAAIYLGGEPPMAGRVQQRPAFMPPPAASCPSDAELLRPVSAGALANAYARARACFAKQIQAGRGWRDIR